MKKLILAAAVASVASFHASAEVSIGGELEYRYDSNETDVSFFKDSVVTVGAAYEVLDGVTATADIDLGETTTGGANSVIGFDFGAAAVSYGQMDNANDGFGVETAIGGAAGTAFSGYKAEVLGVSADLGVASVFATNQEGTGTDVLVSASVEAVDLQFGYQDTDTNDTVGVAVSFDAGMATIGFDYSDSDTTSVTNIMASVPVAETTTATFGISDDDAAGTTAWYANVSYKFPMAKKVKLYAEISDEDTTADTELLAGVEIKF